MWNETEDSRATVRSHSSAAGSGPGGALRKLTPLVLLGALLTALVAVPLAAQDTESAAVAEPTTATELAARVASQYEVLPVRDGVVLRPDQEYRGVRAIEIVGDSVAINGETVPEEAVRGWLGPQADDVLALAAMDPDARQALFDVTGPAPPSAGPEALAGVDGAGASPPSPETPAAPAAEAVPEVEPPAPPAPRARRGSQTGFGSNVYVAPDEVVDDVVVLGGSVTVDGRVDGDVVVVGGRLEINGDVDENAAVIGGSMVLGPHAKVGGDVSVAGGSLRRDPGARIGGKIEQVERGWHLAPIISPRSWDIGWRGWSPWNEMGDLFSLFIFIVLVGLLVAIVLAVGRGSVERLSERIALEPLKAGVVGLLVALLLFPVLLVVSVLLFISIIGIPIFVILLLAFIFLGMPALLLICLVGYTAVSHRVGAWLGRRFGWNLESPFAAAVVGLAATFSLIVVSQLLDVFGGPVHFFAAMFMLAGMSVLAAAGCVGFGAVFLQLWSGRGGGSRRGPGLPPVPAGPVPPSAETPGWGPSEGPETAADTPAYAEPWIEPETSPRRPEDGPVSDDAEAGEDET